MTTAPEHIIPGVGGWHGTDDPRGSITFGTLPADMQDRLDATHHADYQRRSGIRDSTPDEMALLRHLGLSWPSDHALKTVVTFTTSTLRHLSWPALAGQTPTDPTASE
jgi:hypothetical protein